MILSNIKTYNSTFMATMSYIGNWLVTRLKPNVGRYVTQQLREKYLYFYVIIEYVESKI